MPSCLMDIVVTFFSVSCDLFDLAGHSLFDNILCDMF